AMPRKGPWSIRWCRAIARHWMPSWTIWRGEDTQSNEKRQRNRMVGRMDLTWALVLIPFVSAAVGAYFGGYLKKKGENLATHEDIDQLVAQVSAVTQSTKE